MKEASTKELLDMLLARLHVDESNPLTAIHHEWMEIIGPDLAVHTRIVDIRGHVLVIEADHPTWASMAMMRKAQIVGRLKRQFPELGITRLQVRSGDPGRRS
jgi:predicted nucleic acid-binding Zn ribbon protein